MTWYFAAFVFLYLLAFTFAPPSRQALHERCLRSIALLEHELEIGPLPWHYLYEKPALAEPRYRVPTDAQIHSWLEGEPSDPIDHILTHEPGAVWQVDGDVNFVQIQRGLYGSGAAKRDWLDDMGTCP